MRLIPIVINIVFNEGYYPGSGNPRTSRPELVSGADEPSKYCVLAVFFTSYIFIINLLNRELVIIDK